MFDINKKTVNRIIKKIDNGEKIERKTRKGKNIKLDIDDHIKNILCENYSLNLRQIKAILKEKHNITCSKVTIRKKLISNGYLNKMPTIKPLLTTSHIIARRLWGHTYYDFNWDNVIWSDETMLFFCLFKQKNVVHSQTKNQKFGSKKMINQ